MSDSPEKRALDALLDEAKEDFVPRDVDIHWGRVEEKMMARIAAEESPLLRDARQASSGRARALRVGAIALAAAAAAAVFVRRDRDASLLDPQTTTSIEAQNGGALRATEGSGEIRIGGAAVSAGHVLRAGDVVEADEARGIVERPRKVTWLIEPDGEAKAPARATVKSADESLVLALHDGAIEAQVVPVPSGEAFAVDVASGGKIVRVAVHGTHLRVTRRGKHMVVDLSEGVVSIGVPPRTGSTYGTLVTAPAHVELDVDDLDRSIRIDHAPASVRTPIPLGAHEAPAAAAAARNEGPGAVAKPAPAPPAATQPVAAKHDLPAPPKAPANVEAPKAIAPRDAIASAIRACAAAHNRPSEVHVSVSSTLKLKVAPSGEVQSAVFDPPLQPEIQTCAAPVIYKTKFADGDTGMVTVPVDFAF